jgi:hypothetical protein
MNNARDELMLDSMGSTPSGFEIKTHAGGPETAETLLFIADSMRATLDEYEAENYLEMEVKASDGKRYIMTLQRAGKVTPHQARVKAEEALEASKPRTIETVEELDALPAGSVILDPIGLSLQKIAFTGWNSSNGAKEIGADMLEREALPATVLYEPAP